MGKNSKEYTVGYKYKMGVHAVLCQSPIDALTELKFKDRRAWRGWRSDGVLTIDKPGFWGGKKREGGISGYISVEDGGATQTANSYLQTATGQTMPGFRGVFALVFQRFYWANNPYIKPFQARVQNVFNTYGTAAYGDWKPALAPINGEVQSDYQSIYIAMDKSDSMANGSPTRLSTQYTAVKALLESLKGSKGVSIKLVTYHTGVADSTQALNCSDSDIDTLKAWVDALGASTAFGTDYDDGVSLASAFFAAADAADTRGGLNQQSLAGTSAVQTDEATGLNERRRVIMFLTDGEALPTASATDAATTVAGINNVEVYCFNIDLADTTYTDILDNTPVDGVPVVDGSDANTVQQALTAITASFTDLNPAHIIRDALTAPNGNPVAAASEIGATFDTVAQTLFDEGFGLSFHWQNSGDVDSFVKTVERHIDGRVYFDRLTGKWEVKLIRDDYDPSALFTFNSGNVAEWGDIEEPLQAELPNHFVLEYTKRGNGDPASISLTNPAAVQEVGRIIPETLKYEGITWPPLAARVLKRDLAARSIPLKSGWFRCTYVPTTVDLGSAIYLDEPRLGLNNLVARVTELEEGDGLDNSVMIRWVQDAFAVDATDAEAIISDEAATDLDYTALVPDLNFMDEIPYWLLYNQFGATELAARLSSDPDLGYWHGSTNKPNDQHVSITLARYDTTAWFVVGSADFGPYAVLAELMTGSSYDTTFTVPESDQLYSILVNDLLIIDSEIMRVDSISFDGTTATFTVGRGVLDTVPADHFTGAAVFVFSNYAAGDFVQYTAGETVTARLLPQTRNEVLEIGDATSQQVTFASRAYLPYPAGRLQIDGDFWPAGPIDDSITVTWAHRDRLQQVTTVPEDHADASIGPEAGVTYTFRVYSVIGDTDFFARSTYFNQGVDFFLGASPTRTLVYYEDLADSPIPTSVTFDNTGGDLFDSPGISDVFDTTQMPDWFRAPMGRRVVQGDYEIRATRGAYDNWQDAAIRTQPLFPPYDLEVEAA